MEYPQYQFTSTQRGWYTLAHPGIFVAVELNHGQDELQFFDFGDVFVAQEYDGVLSRKANTDIRNIGAMVFKISHCKRVAAISRLDFVIDPCGFLSLTTRLMISYSHPARHMVLLYARGVIIHTYPSYIPDVSITQQP